MRRADAPPAGWYPDPTGGSSLRWWDGLDWTESRAAPPSGGIEVPQPSVDVDDDLSEAGDRSLRAAQRAVGSAPSSALDRQTTSDIMAEVRKVARSEVDRATDAVRQQAQDAQRRIEPLISQYGTTAIRWLKFAVVAAVVLLVLWFVLQVVTQASLMDWLGDRVDGMLEGAAVGPWTTAGGD